MSEHQHEWVEPELDYFINEKNEVIKIIITWSCKGEGCYYVRKKKQLFDLENSFSDERIDLNNWEFWSDY